MNGKTKCFVAAAVITALFAVVQPLSAQDKGGLGGGAMTSTIDSFVSKCALVNPAVAANFLIPFRSGSGLLLGLHGGYTFTVYSNTFNWFSPYVRLVVGGYGFSE